MPTIALQRPFLLKTSSFGIKTPHRNDRASGIWTMSANWNPSQTRKQMEISKELRTVSATESVPVVAPAELQFDKPQPQDQMLFQENRLQFGQFVARKAVLDEEYWTAAWLRAESHWEDRRNDRFADNYKRKFAEQEYNALKRRSNTQLGHKCTCMVAVKKENRDVKHTVLKSVVGTLDLSIQYLSQGETFPGERVKNPLFCSIDRKSCRRYGYISNLCVAKSARRQGIASKMILFAISSAKRDGAEQVFVHVHRFNTPAQELYHKMGFQMVEAARFDKSNEQIYLLQLGS
nr:uncharacterized protein LOC113694602 [Coffea arabica]XP_027069282.1 uncharacterized protein LOC113694635 [Coffea arabica]